MILVKPIKFHSLEPSAKYEGKWVANATIASEPFPQSLWLSTKQMGVVQKNLKHQGILWAAIDYTKMDKPRFVWCSTNQEWLTKAFVKEEDKKDTLAEVPTTVSEVKTMSDDDIPF